MRFKRRVSIVSGQLELTPLVDVVLLLLIFFLLSSSYFFSPGIKVDLPESKASSDIQITDLVITITERNEIYFRDREQPLVPSEDYKELRTALRDVRAAHGDQVPRIILKADNKISFGLAVQVMNVAWEEGFTNLAIATRRKESS
jgi:biopolymer transport protein ExbD